MLRRWTWLRIAGAALAGVGACTLSTEGTNEGGTSSTSAGGHGAGGEDGDGGHGGAPGTGGHGGAGGTGGSGGSGGAPVCDDPVWGKRLAQAPEFQPGLSGTPMPVRLAVDSGGGLLVASGFDAALDLGDGPLVHEGWVDVLVASFDGEGDLRWAHAFAPDGNTDQWAEDVAVDSLDSVLITGVSSAGIDFGGGPTPTQGANAFLAKFNKDGVHTWSRDLPSSHGVSIAVDSQDAAVVAGVFTAQFEFEAGTPINHGGGQDAFVAKWDSLGNRVWIRPYGDGPPQRALGVAAGPGDALFVVGEFEGALDIDPADMTTWMFSDGGRDGFVLKLDANGDLQWRQQIGGTGGATARGVAVDSSGDVVVVGDFDAAFLFGGQTVQSNSEDVFVAKLRGDNGDVVWLRTFITPETQDFRSVAIGENDTIHVIGHYLDAPDFGGDPLPVPLENNDDKEDILVLVLDTAGGHLFSAGYGTNNNDRGVDIATAGCGVLVSGTFHHDFTFGEGAEITEDGGGPETFLARYLLPLR